MKKYTTTILLLLILFTGFGQTPRKVSAYLSAQYISTLHDRTLKTNPQALGAGLQLFMNNSSKFKPIIDITADAFLGGVKVLMLDEAGRPLKSIEGMVNVFGGASYHPTAKWYLSLVGGPSFINGETLFGIKPSIGLYFTKKQILTGKISYLNVSDRIGNKDFGAIALSFGVKLF